MAGGIPVAPQPPGPGLDKPPTGPAFPQPPAPGAPPGPQGPPAYQQFAPPPQFTPPPQFAAAPPYPQPPAFPQPPHYPGGGMGLPPQFLSPKGLGTAVVVLLSICIAAQVILFGASANLSGILSDVESGEYFTFQELEDAGDGYDGAFILSSLMILATGIVFICWFYRTRVNAELFAPGGQRLGRGWAIGGWFVPVVNLWFPKQIANDVWRSSVPWGRNPRLGLVTAWWVLWLIMSILSGAASVVAPDEIGAGDIDELQTETALMMLSGVVGVAAAIVALIYVRRQTAYQLEKYAQGPGPQPQPPGYGFPGGPVGPGGAPGGAPYPYPPA
ncbi:DUF4328 domain-containing protein [Streptomyces sp. DSM 44917]|uniref:DUF4328 domain-containing protein n=1 Tax=Streptomyces boetiae TaxID=3075541 RepID=A0ABU2L2M6_9ACTN|nr:DUF4328 domain-containing protein [Streptomyces sp. DSM 44917]MDT0305775.1 DUF4328 domain-containing protein [Streptomyces sp. DSM 44917]